jgi:hypothetical protein
MSTITKIKRVYAYFDNEEKKDKYLTVVYSVYKDNNKITDIKNEYGHSIVKNSECWDYINAVTRNK